MLMVVFGAGASYDSFAEYPPISFKAFHELAMPRFELEQGRPPLAAELFHERFADLFRTGVVDPVQVVRVGLLNAASVAGMLLTADALVVDGPAEGGA